MAQYIELLQELGLAKNEARIYESLLREGESSVGHIADKSGVHRRNVYDSLKRLGEKGLVFEVLERTENHYQAVDPGKLSELVREKEEKLEKIMPALQELYVNVPYTEEVFMYRGTEGWKNYLNDVLRLGKEVFLIGAVDVISDTKVAQYMENFYKEVKRKNISFRVLYRADTSTKNGKVSGLLAEISAYKILPKEYPITGAVAVFGDRVVLFSDTYKEGDIVPNALITVIKNRDISKTIEILFGSLWLAAGEARS